MQEWGNSIPSFLPLPKHSNTANVRARLGVRKPLVFMGSSLRDMRKFPEDVRRALGRALLDVQCGDTPESARPFGEGVAGVVKLIEDSHGETYRAAYTVELPNAVYVLHAFQKKAKHGIATPRRDIALVRARLQAARAHHG